METVRFYFNVEGKNITEEIKEKIIPKGLQYVPIIYKTEEFGLLIDSNQHIKELNIEFPEVFHEGYVLSVINVIKKIYRITKVGGYGRDEYDGSDAKDEASFEAYKHSRFKSATLLTPEEVKKYGREKVLKAPCEIIEEWEDGAIFLLINKNMFASNENQLKKLREHFNE